MQDLFLELVKLSLIGSLFALAVMLVRLVFRKAPKWIFVLLWGMVAIRLVIPLSIESDLSLVPDRLATGQIITNVSDNYIGEVDIIFESNAGYSNALEAGRQPIHSEQGNYVVTQKASLEPPKTVGETVFPALSRIWLAGAVLMLAYTAGSFFLLKWRMKEATLLRENIWQCEQAASPFVLGIVRPRIYLPYTITGSDMDNVIAHERAHIRRKDHLWKPIGFLLLSIHWFNPVMWLAYILLCRDIEAACDEKVIKNMDKDAMRAYSTALLNCSVPRRQIAACPLAFGETGVKERIKNVMHYKKPAFWIILTAVIVGVVVVVCFLTNPKTPSFDTPSNIQTNTPEPNIHSNTYKVTQVTYENGMNSFSVVAGENSPVYTINDAMYMASLNEFGDEGVWTQLGKLEKTELTQENFDGLFQPDGWKDQENAKHIRENNAYAWQLIYKQDVLYYVLYQKDGELYLAYGSDTEIRWLYKLAVDAYGENGTVAWSAGLRAPVVTFPAGTTAEACAEAVHWLTVDLDTYQYGPFSILQEGKIMYGLYNVFDAETFAPLDFFLPSGQAPQTYIFKNADPNRAYIVTARFSNDPDADVYAFGTRFARTRKNILKAWTGEFSEDKLKNTITEYKISGKSIALEKNGNVSEISIETDFDVSACSVTRVSRVDDKDINVELTTYIDLAVEANCDGKNITVHTDWWLGDDGWAKNYPIWSYLVCAKDADGIEHYYYFRVDYSASQQTEDNAQQSDISAAYPGWSYIQLSYCGGRPITIFDKTVCTELLTRISAVRGEQGESTKGYYGSRYGITVYTKEGEKLFHFSVWDETQYFTSEHRDDEGYSYFFKGDLTELNEYLERNYPDDYWRSH